MHVPEWVSPAFLGAGAGAIALAVAGFAWGGWVTDGTARRMADNAAAAAVVVSLTPYCLERSRTDPRSSDVLADLKIVRAFQRPDLVVQAGWATPLGEDRPNRALASACEQALAAAPSIR
ncbi:hypothetical protein [Kumtagia ephedrae]|jgi:hypothetical protein|uniref:Uncharacterized protein n=1 Tax=Kumtagia ephedrae TaxID=2116701 RepID=A0A2P7S4W9_9HYPH|nr:hypothetical protein [Mesorhizobium ephedrae]PSJ57520.1 hypothetical protein C7I84_17930 [Mesorhizobium ephedrae]